MTTTNGTRKILDLKVWQQACVAPATTAAATFIVSSRHFKQQQLYIVNATTAYLYNPYEDGWVQVASPALGGTFGAGACGVAVAVGPAGTAGVSSTDSTIATTLTLARDLRGYSIHITGGTNKGLTLPILSNTVGANAVITVAQQGAAFDNTSTYRLLTPRWYVLNAVASAGTTTANLFKFYDFALNTWTAAETGATDGVAPAAVIGTDGRLVSTPSWMDDGYLPFASGDADAGGTGTQLIDATKTWATNQWANYQVRIVTGTGAGQIRTIASNNGTTLTVSSSWGTNPDATSTYSIEGNDDFIYYTGSGGTAFYRYSISGGTWTSLATRTAPGVGLSAHWIWGVTEADWTNESAILNGRYIYSFRGAGGALLDRYDIAANTWAAVSYAPGVETFTTGTKYAYVADAIYIQKDATGRWFRFDVARQSMDGWCTMSYPNGTAVLGDTAFDVTYHDGATDIVFVHMVLNTSTVHLRQMVI